MLRQNKITAFMHIQTDFYTAKMYWTYIRGWFDKSVS